MVLQECTPNLYAQRVKKSSHNRHPITIPRKLREQASRHIDNHFIDAGFLTREPDRSVYLFGIAGVETGYPGNRASADTACASSPSDRASTAAVFPSASAPGAEQLIMLLRF